MREYSSIQQRIWLKAISTYQFKKRGLADAINTETLDEGNCKV